MKGCPTFNTTASFYIGIFPDKQAACLGITKFSGVYQRCFTKVVAPVYVSSCFYQDFCRIPFSSPSGTDDRRHALVVALINMCPPLDQCLDEINVPLLRPPHQGSINSGPDIWIRASIDKHQRNFTIITNR